MILTDPNERRAFKLSRLINELAGRIDAIELFQIEFPTSTLGHGAHYELDRAERLLKGVRQRDKIRKQKVA